jgi:hypothetical protein
MILWLLIGKETNMAFAIPMVASLAMSVVGGLLSKAIAGGGDDSPAPAAPSMVDAGGTANPQTSQQAEDKVRKQSALASGGGKGNSILTSPLGLLDQAAGGKTSLLGQ